jgi:hypothetical protein
MLGREATKEEFKELSDEEGKAQSVTREDVIAAFTEGEEVGHFEILLWDTTDSSFLIRHLAFG